ncbi:MAG: hypothetical protein NVSMB33_15840 [Ktedonobacteraceae bacterium]
MIASEIMTTQLITVTSDDTLSHVANLLRQYRIHQLPVVRRIHKPDVQKKEYIEHRSPLLLLEGLITSQDIDLIVAVEQQSSSSDVLHRPWQERHVSEVMHRASIRVTPMTSVAAAAQILVEQSLNCLPVVEYEYSEHETQTVLVGLLTRSDLLMALARSLGAFEPGMDLIIPLPIGDLTPLAQTLLFAAELHVLVRNVIVAPLKSNTPLVATLRLGTINPTSLLVRLQDAGIHYMFPDPVQEGSTHV